MADRSAGIFHTPVTTMRWPVEAEEYEPLCPPLVPKKSLAGRRYRLKPEKLRTVTIDTHGIVDWPMPDRDFPPTRWLGYVMGYVKEDREPVDWDAKAMAHRPKRVFLKPE